MNIFDACKNGNIKFVKKYLETNNNNDIYNKYSNSNEFKWNILHYAVINKKYKIVKLLLKHNSNNLNNIDSFGNTSFYYACLTNNNNIIILLLKHNIDINISNHNGNTVLHLVCKQQNIKLIKLLLNHGANYELKNNENKRPFSLLNNRKYKKIWEYVKKIGK